MHLMIRLQIILGRTQRCRNWLLASSCLSVCPQATTRFPLLSWNFVRVFFETLSRNFKFHYNMRRITATLHEDLCTLLISRWILLRMRNVADKWCRKNQNIFYVVCSVTFFLDVEKYGRVIWAADDNIKRRMLMTCWVTKATDTHQNM